MKKIIDIVCSPETAGTKESIQQFICKNYGFLPEEISGIQILKKSLDARRNPIKVNIQILVLRQKLRL